MLLQFSLRVWSWMSYTRWDMGLAGSRSSALVGVVTEVLMASSHSIALASKGVCSSETPSGDPRYKGSTER